MGAEESTMAHGGEEGAAGAGEKQRRKSSIPEGLIMASHVPPASKAVLQEHWDFRKEQKNLTALNRGDTLFKCACTNGSDLTKAEATQMDLLTNLTSFEDETEENNSPPIDMLDPEQAKLYTGILVKTMYVLPGVTVKDLTPELIASHDYQVSCQPGQPRIWKEVPDKVTMRMTKVIIPVVFKMTIQFRVSEITDKEVLAKLASVDKAPPDYAILMERTKRNKAVVDATRKVKSVLLYHEVDDGLLVTNMTVVLNTDIPGFVSPVINNLGTWGAPEASDTAVRTRAYFKRRAAEKKKQSLGGAKV